MIQLGNGTVDYEFVSNVMFVNGHQSKLRKVEHLSILKEKNGKRVQ